MSHAEVYSQSMRYLGHSFPLWHPEPGDIGEVAIGDVGVIRDGRFRRLFNVTASAVHSLNKGGVPAEFVPFYDRDMLVRTCDAYLRPGIYTSRNVSIRRSNDTNVQDTVSSTYTVESHGYGALLILGSSARQEVLIPNRRLHSYIRTNRHYWHKFALDHSEACGLEDLILVRGVVKTSSDWMLAALTRTEPKHQSMATFPPVASLSPPITLELQASTKMIPRFGAITLTQNADNGGPTRHMDQCIFINFRRAKNHGDETISKCCKIYGRQLGSLGHGMPLWRPDIRLPGCTADTVKLGDVGIVYDGAFHRIFNITVDSSDPLNKLGVPVDFEPYRIGSATTYYHSPDVYASNAVDVQLNQSSTGMECASGVTPLYRVTCESEDGALLILHEPAISKVLSPNKVFRYYVAQNRNAWHEFISKQLSIPVDPDDIILVQGFMKCLRWTAASFLNHSKTNSYIEGAFNAKRSDGEQEELVWVDERRRNMSVEVRSGQESTRPPDCVFLVKFTYEDWSLMRAVSRTFRSLPKNPLGIAFQRLLGGSLTTLNDRPSPAPRHRRRTSFTLGTPSDSSYMYTADTSRRSRSMLSVSAASEPAKGLGSWLVPKWLGPTSRSNGPSTPSRPNFTSAPASILGLSPVMSRQSSVAPPIDIDRPPIRLDMGSRVERFAQSFVKSKQDSDDPHDSTSSKVVQDFENVTTGEPRDQWMKHIIRLILHHDEEQEYLESIKRSAKAIAESVSGQRRITPQALRKQAEYPTRPPSIYATQITSLNLTDFSTDHDAGVSRALDLILRQDHPYEQVVRVALSDASCSSGLADVILEKMQEILDQLQAQRLVIENPSSDKYKQWSSLRKVLLPLCKTLHRVPPSLFLTDIVCPEHEHPVDGGSFSDIFMATRQGHPVALKRLRVFRSDLSAGKDLTKASFHQEIVVWRQLRHSNILPLLGLDQDTFRDVEMICMVSPWMAHGNINQCIQKLSVQNETAPLTSWVHGIASGLRYLHDEHLVHGDLRGANILVDHLYHVRIADFGLTRLADLTGSRTPYFPGASRWVAPEILSGHKPSYFGDVYAFGCVCLEICTRKAPFHDFVDHQVITMKIAHRTAPDWPEREDSSTEAKIRSVILPCWDWNAASRPRMVELEEELKALMYEVEFATTSAKI